MADFAAAVRKGLDGSSATPGDGTRDGEILHVLGMIESAWRRAFAWKVRVWADRSDDDPDVYYLYCRRPWTIWSNFYFGKVIFYTNKRGGYVRANGSDHDTSVFADLDELPEALEKIIASPTVAAGLVRIFGAVPSSGKDG